MRPWEAEGRDPETAPERLYHVADYYPDAVLANPALALLSIEDPATFQKIVFRARARQAQMKVYARARVMDRLEVIQALAVLLEEERWWLIDPKLIELTEATVKRVAGLRSLARVPSAVGSMKEEAERVASRAGLATGERLIAQALFHLLEELSRSKAGFNPTLVAKVLADLHLATRQRAEKQGRRPEELEEVNLDRSLRELRAFGGEP